MAELFPDIGLPDWGLSEQSNKRVQSVQFGDGYHQRAPDGINHKQRTWSPNWNNLDPDVALTAFEWLDERKEVTAFDWVHPRLGIKRVLCTSVKSEDAEWGNSRLSATFVEDFNP